MAYITRESLVSVFVEVFVVGLICWLFWFLISYFAPPEPFNKILRCVVALIAVLFLVNVLLGISGHPWIVW